MASGNACVLFGHDYDDGVITTPPTRLTNGLKTFTCKKCKTTYTVNIPKLEVAEAEIYEVDGVKYVDFGSYPQTHVNDAALILKLNKLTIVNSRGYYEYNGCEYAKITAKPYYWEYNKITTYFYSDGAEVKKDSVDFFKVEPIKWRILEQKDGTVKVMSSLIIDASCYYINQSYRKDENGNDIAPNNYKYSTIREFLNNKFFTVAFTLPEKNAICTVEVENGASSGVYSPNNYLCENTFDKVFLLSEREANIGGVCYSHIRQRRIGRTDYAIANGAYGSVNYGSDTVYGIWWWRTPFYYTNYFAVACGVDGVIIRILSIMLFSASFPL